MEKTRKRHTSDVYVYDKEYDTEVQVEYETSNVCQIRKIVERRDEPCLDYVVDTLIPGYYLVIIVGDSVGVTLGVTGS